MKKIVLSTMGAFFLTAVMFSCNQPKETEVSPTTAKAGEETMSVIDQMEKEEGVKFFKKDVTLTDESGKNKVVMRFAATDKDKLESYLANYEYSITPIFSKEKSVSPLPQTVEDATDNSYSLSQSIITEPLLKNLQGDAIGYTTHVKQKLNLNIKKARLATTYSQFATHVSDTWPSHQYIWAQGGPIRFSFRIKGNWTMSWSSPQFITELAWGGSEDRDIGLQYDSPWKSRLEVDYNHSYDYSFNWTY